MDSLILISAVAARWPESPAMWPPDDLRASGVCQRASASEERATERVREFEWREEKAMICLPKTLLSSRHYIVTYVLYVIVLYLPTVTSRKCEINVIVIILIT